MPVVPNFLTFASGIASSHREAYRTISSLPQNLEHTESVLSAILWCLSMFTLLLHPMSPFYSRVRSFDYTSMEKAQTRQWSTSLICGMVMLWYRPIPWTRWQQERGRFHWRCIGGDIYDGRRGDAVSLEKTSQWYGPTQRTKYTSAQRTTLGSTDRSMVGPLNCPGEQPTENRILLWREWPHSYYITQSGKAGAAIS